jgi:hypothetical protein
MSWEFGKGEILMLLVEFIYLFKSPGPLGHWPPYVDIFWRFHQLRVPIFINLGSLSLSCYRFTSTQTPFLWRSLEKKKKVKNVALLESEFDNLQRTWTRLQSEVKISMFVSNKHFTATKLEASPTVASPCANYLAIKHPQIISSVPGGHHFQQNFSLVRVRHFEKWNALSGGHLSIKLFFHEQIWEND